MITFDFDYYRPGSIEEAVKTYTNLTGQGKNVIYYAGGTEIISLARMNQIRFDAVIDIKEIPECKVLEFQENNLIIGAAVCLTKITDSGYFPLLSAVCRKAADHTARDKISLGGNICGKTPYKEAILPLLLADSDIMVAGEAGIKTLPLVQCFNKELMLGSGEFLIRIITDKNRISLPYFNLKRTGQESVGYPIVTIAAVKENNRIKVAFSGVCGFPFRLREIEDDLNNMNIPPEARINNAIKHLPAPLLDDILGSAAYREFLLRNAISEIIEKLGGMS